jgi:phosphatidylglycerophosphatase C
MSTVVALFDFDGTLGRGDSLLPFLRRVAGPTELALALGRHITVARDRDRYKERVLATLLAGREVQPIAALATSFGAELVAGHLRTEVVAHLREHQAAGHRTALVSASPALYLEEVRQRLAIDFDLSTRLAVGDDGRFTGALDGGNCRGPEKARRAAELIGRLGADEVHAYGDSSGDAELLALAEVPHWVGRRPHRPDRARPGATGRRA